MAGLIELFDLSKYFQGNNVIRGHNVRNLKKNKRYIQQCRNLLTEHGQDSQQRTKESIILQAHILHHKQVCQCSRPINFDTVTKLDGEWVYKTETWYEPKGGFDDWNKEFCYFVTLQRLLGGSFTLDSVDCLCQYARLR